jgi:hypothetical protein
MLQQLEALSRDHLQGKLPGKEYAAAVVGILTAKGASLGPFRDVELLDFAKKLSHFG